MLRTILQGPETGTFSSLGFRVYLGFRVRTVKKNLEYSGVTSACQIYTSSLLEPALNPKP